MNLDDFHLERMIFIDSYKPNGIVEVAIDGHANLNGFNGAGKTSLLRLLLLFYGEMPSRILRGEKSKESLIGHYLPRATSYIAFEYARRGQLCLAVLHSNTTAETVHYRFIGSGYRRDMFVEGGGNLVQTGDLFKHVAKLSGQIECTSALSRQDYTAIIQNRVEKREHRTLAARFAFVDSRHSLTNIEKIVTGMFERNITFRALRQMIVSCIADAEGKIEIGVRKEALQSWCQEFEAYQRVMQEEDRFRLVEQSHADRTRHFAELAEVKGWIAAYVRWLDEEDAASSAEIATINKEEGAVRAAAQEQSNSLRAQLSQATSLAEAAQKALTQIDDRRNKYERDRIQEKVRLVDELPRNQEEEQVRAGELDRLLGANATIADQYAELERNERQHCSEKTGHLTDGKDPIRVQFTEQRDAIQAERGEHEHALRAQAEVEKEGITADIRRASHEAGRLSGIIDQTMPDAHLQDLFKAKSDEVECALQARESYRCELDTARTAYAQAKDRFDLSDQEKTNASKRVENLKDELHQTLQVAHAGPDCLLGFLRRDKPGWVNDIARVLPPEILLRTDLEPELIEQSADGLYGVRIATERIDPPDLADEQVIAQKIEDLRGRLDAATERFHKAGREADAANQEREQRARAREAAQSAKNEAERTFTIRSTEWDSLKVQVAQNVRNKKKSAIESLQFQTQQIADLEAEILKVSTALVRSLADAERAYAERLRVVNESERDKIGAIDLAIGSARAQLDQRINDLSAERDRSLAQKGVDIETIKRVRTQINTLKDAINKGRDAQAEVAQYQNWLQDTWARREDFVLQLGNERSAERSLQASLTAVDRALNDKLTLLWRRRDVKDHAIEQNDATRDALTQRVRTLAEVDLNPETAAAPHDPARNLNFISKHINQAKAEIKRLDEDIRTQLEAVIRAFTGTPGTYTDKFYESYRKEFRAGALREEEQQKIRALGEWFDTRHGEPQRLLHGQAGLHGQAIHEFHQALRRFKDQASRFSNGLQSSIDSSIAFDRISGIQARLTSGIDDLEYWRVIKAFSTEFELWVSSGKEGLPDQEFLTALRRVVDCFQGEQGLSADLIDLVQLEIDLVENGRHVTTRNEQQLVHASSTGLSYLILIVIFIGFLSRIRGDASVQVVFSVDELKNLDLPNTEKLFGLLERHRITLLSAFPDADPDVLRLFEHRYTILEDRTLARVELEHEYEEEDQDEAFPVMASESPDAERLTHV